MMHITKLTKLTALAVLLVSGSLSAQEVYNWRSGSGSNAYSDVPRNLKPSNANVINVRTQRVTPPAPAAPADTAAADGSLAEQQAELNNKLAQQNKEIEERNKKIDEENRQQREADCKRARLNRTSAESARVINREELLQRYDQDIAAFCK